MLWVCTNWTQWGISGQNQKTTSDTCDRSLSPPTSDLSPTRNTVDSCDVLLNLSRVTSFLVSDFLRWTLNYETHACCANHAFSMLYTFPLCQYSDLYIGRWPFGCFPVGAWQYCPVHSLLVFSWTRTPIACIIHLEFLSDKVGGCSFSVNIPKRFWKSSLQLCSQHHNVSTLVAPRLPTLNAACLHLRHS